MPDKRPNRPEHSPKGYEWLPDAYTRDAGPHDPEARENLRQALAEGECEPLLRISTGQPYPIPIRMWDKEPVAGKVYPLFESGWMRMRLLDAIGSEWTGPYVKGWVFIRSGSRAAWVGPERLCGGASAPATILHQSRQGRTAPRSTRTRLMPPRRISRV